MQRRDGVMVQVLLAVGVAPHVIDAHVQFQCLGSQSVGSDQQSRHTKYLLSKLRRQPRKVQRKNGRNRFSNLRHVPNRIYPEVKFPAGRPAVFKLWNRLKLCI
jgi:hypothetical protein